MILVGFLAQGISILLRWKTATSAYRYTRGEEKYSNCEEFRSSTLSYSLSTLVSTQYFDYENFLNPLRRAVCDYRVRIPFFVAREEEVSARNNHVARRLRTCIRSYLIIAGAPYCLRGSLFWKLYAYGSLYQFAPSDEAMLMSLLCPTLRAHSSST